MSKASCMRLFFVTCYKLHVALNPTVLSYLCPAFELKSQKNTKHTVLYLRDTYSSDKVCWKLMRWMSHNPAQIPKYIVPAVIQQTPDGWIKSFISYIIIRCGISVCRFSLLSVDVWTCFWIYRRACGCEGGTYIYLHPGCFWVMLCLYCAACVVIISEFNTAKPASVFLHTSFHTL